MCSNSAPLQTRGSRISFARLGQSRKLLEACGPVGAMTSRMGCTEFSVEAVVPAHKCLLSQQADNSRREIMNVYSGFRTLLLTSKTVRRRILERESKGGFPLSPSVMLQPLRSTGSLPTHYKKWPASRPLQDRFIQMKSRGRSKRSQALGSRFLGNDSSERCCMHSVSAGLMRGPSGLRWASLIVRTPIRRALEGWELLLRKLRAAPCRFGRFKSQTSEPSVPAPARTTDALQIYGPPQGSG